MWCVWTHCQKLSSYNACQWFPKIDTGHDGENFVKIVRFIIKKSDFQVTQKLEKYVAVFTWSNAMIWQDFPPSNFCLHQISFGHFDEIFTIVQSTSTTTTASKQASGATDYTAAALAAAAAAAASSYQQAPANPLSTLAETLLAKMQAEMQLRPDQQDSLRLQQEALR